MSRDVWQLGGTGSCSGGTVLIFLSGGRSSEHRAFTLSSASPDARVEQRVPPGREVRLGSWQPACLPACLPITVKFAAWTVTVVMLAVGLRWLWAAEGRGCEPGLKFRRVSRSAATSGPPAVRPGGDCSSSGRRDVSAINESNEAAVDCTGTDVHTMVSYQCSPFSRLKRWEQTDAVSGTCGSVLTHT